MFTDIGPEGYMLQIIYAQMEVRHFPVEDMEKKVGVPGICACLTTGFAIALPPLHPRSAFIASAVVATMLPPSHLTPTLQP